MTAHTLLLGTVGSTAYGLNHADSDLDLLAVYAEDTDTILSLDHTPETRVAKNAAGDLTAHEAKKFATLALRCNPTVTELLWLPTYDTRTPAGDNLIAIRERLLSRDLVRSAYLGYASEQFKRLERRADGTFSSDTRQRTAKHARHLLRLLIQGHQLYTRGELTLHLENPDEVRDFGERVAAGDTAHARKAMDHYIQRIHRGPCKLPVAPDRAAANSWLLDVRDRYSKPVICHHER